MVCHRTLLKTWQEFFNPLLHPQNHPSPGLFTDLFRQWGKSCQLLREPPGAKLKTAPSEPPCRLLGKCVCSGTGQQAFYMHAKLIQCLRPFLDTPRNKAGKKRNIEGKEKNNKTKASKTEFRVLADSASICLRFQSKDLGDQVESGWGRVAIPEGQAGNTSEELWVHIGHMNHSAQSGFMFSVIPVLKVGSFNHDLLTTLIVPNPVDAQRSLDFFEKCCCPKKLWRFTTFQTSIAMEGFFGSDPAPDALHVSRYLPMEAEKTFWHGEDEERRLRNKAERLSRIKSAKDKYALNRENKAPRAKTKKRPAEPHQGETIFHALQDAVGGDDENFIVSSSSDANDDDSNEPCEESDLEEIPQAAFDEPVFEQPLAKDLDGHAVVTSDGLGPSSPVAVAVETEQARKIRAAAAALPAGTIKVTVPGCGLLVFYEHLDSIQAQCKHSGHGDCRKQRTVLAGRRAGQGRCLGYLTEWLLSGSQHPTQYDHCHSHKTDRKAREAARNHLLTLEGSAELLAKERKQDDGEPDEPIRFV